MIDTRTVGKTIAALRQNRGLSQQGLATLCSVTHQAVSKWENGIALPDMQTMLFLSKLFEVSIEDILSGNLPQNQTTPIHANDEAADEIPQQKKTEDPFQTDDEQTVEAEEMAVQEEDQAALEDEEDISVTWAEMYELFPFASQSTLNELVLQKLQDPTSGKPGRDFIYYALPFLSHSTNETLLCHAVDTMDADMLAHIAPFVSSTFLGKWIRSDERLQNPKMLRSILPFLPRDIVDDVLRKSMDKTGASRKDRHMHINFNWNGKKINKDIDLSGLKNLGNQISDMVNDSLSGLNESLSGIFGGKQNDVPPVPPTPPAPPTPPTPPAYSPEEDKPERTLMRIARKAIETNNIDWLEEHFSDLNSEEMETLCFVIADEGKWEIAEHICDELNSKQLRIFLPAAINMCSTDWLENYYDELSGEDQALACHMIAERQNWQLVEAIDLDVNPNATRILLSAAVKDGNWETATYILEECDIGSEAMENICRIAADSKNWELVRSLCENADEKCLHILLDAAMQEGNWEIINEISEYL